VAQLECSEAPKQGGVFDNENPTLRIRWRQRLQLIKQAVIYVFDWLEIVSMDNPGTVSVE